MNTLHLLSIGLTIMIIMINMISGQTTVWHEQMDTTPTSWTGATPGLLTSDSNCPDPNSYCWYLNSPSSMTRTASTEAFISLQLTYSVVATNLQGSDECAIQYSLDSSVFTDINRISSDTPSSGITDTFNGWGSAADQLPEFSIRLVFEGNGHVCYFNEFILEGTPTPKSPTPQPTQAPTIPTISPTKGPTYPDAIVTSCGTHTKCYHVLIDPFPGQKRSREISIQDNYYSEYGSLASYYHVYITPRDYDCIDPSISLFKYERIDYDNHQKDAYGLEFLAVLNPSGARRQCANVSNACDVFETCFTDFNIGLPKVRKDEETFLLTVMKSGGVRAAYRCSHGLTVNVLLTVTCSDGSAFPTIDPTNLPTTEPTRPSASPTRPSVSPTSLTTAPTFPTIDPTNAPTTATLTPTIHPSSSNGYIGGQLCYGDIAKCWNINIEPIAGELTSAQVNIQGLFAAEDTYYVATFHIIGGVSCEDPSVSFRYERIDNDETNERLSIQIYVGGLVLGESVMAGTCGDFLSNSCGDYELCMDDYSLGMDIAAGESMVAVVTCPNTVETMCEPDHQWVINAVLTLWCGDASHPPTVATPSPSTEAPTIAIDSVSPTDTSTTVNTALIDSQLPTLQLFDDVKQAATDSGESGQVNSHSTIFRTSHTIYASDDQSVTTKAEANTATYIFSAVIIVLVIALIVAVYRNHKNKQQIWRKSTEMVAAVSTGMASASVFDDGALSSDPSHQNAGHLDVVEANGIVPGLPDPDREESSSDAPHPNDEFDPDCQIQPTGTETNTGTKTNTGTLQKEVVVTNTGTSQQRAEGVHTINIDDC